MQFDKWFHSQSKLIQIILLIIPVVNWVCEVLVRWSHYFAKHGTLRLVLCILVTLPTGIIVGWVDLIWTLLFNKLCCE